MPLDQQTRRYQRNFTKDELSLLRQTVEGEIEFCRKQIQIADDEVLRTLWWRIEISSVIMPTRSVQINRIIYWDSK